jgi:hypothetical protein
MKLTIVYIYNIVKNINNATTFFNHKISHKMMMPRKFVWMDKSSCKLRLYVIASIT